MAVVFRVNDKDTEVFGKRFSNQIISCYILFGQLVVVVLSLLQHIFSYIEFKTVFHCDFNSTGINAVLFGHDLIIFDFQLFSHLWGMPDCVANQLDGGYARCAWCICHMVAILTFLATMFQGKFQAADMATSRQETPNYFSSHYVLWPIVYVQSIYGVGLLIMSLAGLPKLVGHIGDDVMWRRVAWPAVFYVIGASVNYFLLYVLWHWYWYVEADWLEKIRGPPRPMAARPRTRRTKPLVTAAAIRR